MKISTKKYVTSTVFLSLSILFSLFTLVFVNVGSVIVPEGFFSGLDTDEFVLSVISAKEGNLVLVAYLTFCVPLCIYPIISIIIGIVNLTKLKNDTEKKIENDGRTLKQIKRSIVCNLLAVFSATLIYRFIGRLTSFAHIAYLVTLGNVLCLFVYRLFSDENFLLFKTIEPKFVYELVAYLSLMIFVYAWNFVLPSSIATDFENKVTYDSTSVFYIAREAAEKGVGILIYYPVCFPLILLLTCLVAKHTPHTSKKKEGKIFYEIVKYTTFFVVILLTVLQVIYVARIDKDPYLHGLFSVKEYVFVLLIQIVCAFSFIVATEKNSKIKNSKPIK